MLRIRFLSVGFVFGPKYTGFPLAREKKKQGQIQPALNVTFVKSIMGHFLYEMVNRDKAGLSGKIRE